MKTLTRSVLFGVLAFVTSAAAQVPQSLGYQGRLLKADGTAESGVVSFTFGLYDAATAGTKLWEESQSLALTDGFYATYLGDTTAFPATLFDGNPRFLQVTVNGQALTPRQKVASVAYALRADTARNVSGGTVNVSSITVNNNTVIDSSGRLAGSAAYTAGSGISINGNSISLQSGCAAGSVLQFDGGAWGCSSVGVGAAVSGDLSGALPSPQVVGLRGVPMAMGAPMANQFLGFNGMAWAPTTLPVATGAALGVMRSGTGLDNTAGAVSVRYGTAVDTALRGDTMIVSALTLQVPSQFADINAALNSLDNRRIGLNGSVTIQVADGTYTMSTGITPHHPDGDRIFIVGNASTPQNVVINFNAANGVTVSNGNRLGLMNGFRLVGIGANSNVGVLGTTGGYVNLGASMQLSNFLIGVSAQSNATVVANGVTVLSCAPNAPGASAVGALASYGGVIFLSRANVTGCTFGIYAQYSSYIDAPSAIVNGGSNNAFYSVFGSSIVAYQARANGGSNCFVASSSASLMAQEAFANNCATSSYYADFGSSVYAVNSQSTTAGTHFLASYGGMINGGGVVKNGTGAVGTVNLLTSTGGYVFHP